MPPLIEARGLTKRFGTQVALDRIDFAVEPGRIVGLIGPNGAGKTTALRAVLGLAAYEGELRVLGREPFAERAELMNEATFIADVAVLPAWLRVEQAVEFVAGVHPRFRRERAQELLAKTEIAGARRIGALSKGMKTMVHLALTMAIDARLLVLDEPTLGLDILARRGFYDALVNDYMDETRTILITTHQVEEVENLLTDVIFIDKGRIVLDCSVEDIAARYAVVAVAGRQARRRARRAPLLRAPDAGQEGALLRAAGFREAGRIRRGGHAERCRSVRRQSLIGPRRMKNYVWLVRREFWENKAIWIIPVAIGCTLTVAALFGRVEIALPAPPEQNRSVAAMAFFASRRGVLRGDVDLLVLVPARVPACGSARTAACCSGSRCRSPIPQPCCRSSSSA